MKGFARRFVCLICVISLCLTLALPARAIAVADDILVAVVLCFLAGAGIALSLPASTDRATVNSTVLDMLRSYASDVGSTLANLFPVAGVWLTGKAYRVNPTFGNALAGFVRWMQGGSYNLTDNSTVNVVPASGLEVIDMYGNSYPVATSLYRDIEKAADAAAFREEYSVIVPSSRTEILFSDTLYMRNTSGTILEYNFTGVSSRASWRNNSTSFLFFYSSGSSIYVYNGFYQSGYFDREIIHDAVPVAGVPSDGIDLVSGTIQNIGEIADTSQLVISSPAIPVGASDLDVASDAVMEQVLEGYGAIVAENDVVLADEGVLDPPVPPVVDDSYPISGLEEIFPFCIPFDLYEFAQILVAEPQAPKFTWEAAFPEAIGGTQTIELDFDTPTWNRVAQILRTMELLLFIVGLAFVTRQLLRG